MNVAKRTNVREKVNEDSLTSAQIARRIVEVRQAQVAGNPNVGEYHATVYDDGIWRVDLEIFAVSGVTRFWVSREDTYRNYNNSLFTMYRAANGELKYSANFKIAKKIVDRLLKVYTILEKVGVQI